jgi:predicted nucleic acid-binding protein
MTLRPASAMILQSAKQLSCARIWTEDLDDGQWIGSVQVTNPF